VTPQEFLQQHFYCDGHADTFARVAFAGADFVTGEGAEYFHIDYPKMKKAGLDLQLMAVYIPPEIARHQGTVTALWIAQFVHRVCDKLGQDCRLIRTKSDLELAASGTGNHLMLTLEGVAPLLNDLDVLEMFFRFGFRSLGITHNANNWAAGGCSPADNHRYGLTDDGKALVRKALGMGVAIDSAHLSRKGFYDLLSLMDGKPLLNTHACCAHFVDIERNLTNDQLVKLADTGGVVGITFVPDFLSSTKEVAKVSSADVFAHMQHAVDLIGIDHVAIGADFDGVRYLPHDLTNQSEVPNLVARMMEAGWSHEDIAKVIGGNWRRVLSQLLPD
jgi:membrane dipeptidase